MSEYLPINFEKFAYHYSEAIVEIVDYFKKELDIQIYVIYGTLLGVVKKQKFLLNDDDIDLAYISKYNKEADVKKELREICSKLEQKELLAKTFRYEGHTWIWNPSKTIQVDLWTSWVDENKYYLIPWVNGCFHSDVLLPLAVGKLENADVLIPNKSNCILQYCYGQWDKLYDNWTMKDRTRVFYYLGA